MAQLRLADPTSEWYKGSRRKKSTAYVLLNFFFRQRSSGVNFRQSASIASRMVLQREQYAHNKTDELITGSIRLKNVNFRHFFLIVLSQLNIFSRQLLPSNLRGDIAIRGVYSGSTTSLTKPFLFITGAGESFACC